MTAHSKTASADTKLKLSWPLKGSYAFADTTFKLMVALTNSYFLLFLTDSVFFSVAAAGSILFFGRILDAISAPLVGAMIDKSNMHAGKNRPWLVIGAVLLFIFHSFLFLNWNPEAGNANIKAIICCLFYAAFCAASNIIYTAFTSMNSTLTTNPKERISLSSLRNQGGAIGSIIAGYALLPIITLFSGGEVPKQKGFFVTALIVGGILVIGYVMLFVTSKDGEKQEKPVSNMKKEDSFTFAETFKIVFTNRPLIALFIADVMRFLAYLLALTMFPYFFIYVAKDPNATAMLFGTTAISTFVGATLVPFITKKLSKRDTYALGMVIIGVSFVAANFLKSNTYLMIGALVIGFVGYAFGATVTTAMYVDVVDYGEVKYGKNARALYFSVYQLSIKVTAIFSTAISGFGLALIGFQAGTDPSLEVVKGINFICLAMPIATLAISFIALLFYNLNNEKLQEVQRTLAEKRRF